MVEMNRTKIIVLSALASLGLSACGNNGVDQHQPVVDAEIADVEDSNVVIKTEPVTGHDGTISKPGAPFSVSYKVIGTPIVGSPVTIQLRVDSTVGPAPMTLDYRINDLAAMMLAESQLESVRLEPASGEEFVTQQVTVVPQREGRTYLNVSASVETEDGTMSTVVAVPIQVGSGGRELAPHGELQVDENGETIRVLTPD